MIITLAGGSSLSIFNDFKVPSQVQWWHMPRGGECASGTGWMSGSGEIYDAVDHRHWKTTAGGHGQ